VSDDKKMRPGQDPTRGASPPGGAQRFGSGALAKIVDLAREELRQRGVSEDQIEELLNRRYADEKLWGP
jgi:hypothetical protein